jgi:hypothetical protein
MESPQTPMRDGWRDGQRGCVVCGAALASPRARYCSRAHPQRAFRLRHRAELPDLQQLRQELQRRRVVVAHTVYECPSCGERLVGERRCPNCNRFGRAIGPGWSLPRMRHAAAVGRPAWRGGGGHSLSYPLRRANGHGHDALLAQSLHKPFGLTHMPTPGATTTGDARCFSG